MKINAKRVVELRKKSSWSQDELATAAALNLRTVQRVENSGTASLQTLKAIAAALEARLEDFIKLPEKTVPRYEYKSVVMPIKMGFSASGLPDVSAALNQESMEGWRLSQVFTPTGSSGQSLCVIAVLERPL